MGTEENKAPYEQSTLFDAQAPAGEDAAATELAENIGRTVADLADGLDAAAKAAETESESGDDTEHEPEGGESDPEAEGCDDEDDCGDCGEEEEKASRKGKGGQSKANPKKQEQPKATPPATTTKASTPARPAALATPAANTFTYPFLIRYAAEFIDLLGFTDGKAYTAAQIKEVLISNGYTEFREIEFDLHHAKDANTLVITIKGSRKGGGDRA
ncbi:MAG TPA: hypothetical protein VD902_21830 [Symbiobacteriaceae bacterium]|nr:hypothetical protein [Symbiobacteriaceae bacterium]